MAGSMPRILERGSIAVLVASVALIGVPVLMTR